MKNLKELISKSKHGFSLEIDIHKGHEISVHDSLELSDSINGLTDEVYEEMVKRDTIVQIIVFPDEVNSAIWVNHYDLDLAIEQMLKELEEYNKGKTTNDLPIN